jgi:hypothetical protein
MATMAPTRATVETSACQIANPDKVCPTKLLEQGFTRIDELRAFIMGDGSTRTFNVFTSKAREVTVVCHGFSLELERDKDGKTIPKITNIKGTNSLTFKVNEDEPQYARSTVQLRSILKLMNILLTGKGENGEPLHKVYTLDDSLKIVTHHEVANAVNPTELAVANSFLTYLKSRPI